VSIGVPGDRSIVLEPTALNRPDDVSSAEVSADISLVPPEFSGAPPRSTREPEPVLLTALAPAEKPRPIYFTPQELHQHPIPIDRVITEEAGRVYPDSATSLSIYINDKGTVDKVDIATTNNPALAAEFADRFRKARYVPGKISGLAVASEFRVEVISTSTHLGLQPKQ
jgi:hypothetical protein